MNRIGLIKSQQTMQRTSTPSVSRIDRRSLLKAGGALSLTALAMGLLPRSARIASAHQDGTPPVAATPVLGAQPDGTNVWKVQVGAVDMENMLDLQGFFPGEITINAGDQIWFSEGMPGFHNVWFGYGGDVPPLFIPDPEIASPVAGPPPVGTQSSGRLPHTEPGRGWHQSGQHWGRHSLGSHRSDPGQFPDTGHL